MMNIDWFYSLNKPFLSPPDWVFAPVWTVLYILILIAFILFIKSSKNQRRTVPMLCFFTQLALNFSWPFVFFGMKNILFALFICALMWLFIFLTIITFLKYSKIVSFLLLPYLLWVSFAFYLNLGFYSLN